MSSVVSSWSLIGKSTTSIKVIEVIGKKIYVGPSYGESWSATWRNLEFEKLASRMQSEEHYQHIKSGSSGNILKGLM